ncbi:MAG: hypothetical protein ACP5O8_03325 [Candidatus Aenigmatarchaeota archaeon]
MEDKREEKAYLKFAKNLLEKFLAEVGEEKANEYIDSFVRGLKVGVKLAEGKDEDFAFCYGMVLGYVSGRLKNREKSY